MFIQPVRVMNYQNNYLQKTNFKGKTVPADDIEKGLKEVRKEVEEVEEEAQPLLIKVIEKIGKFFGGSDPATIDEWSKTHYDM